MDLSNLYENLVYYTGSARSLYHYYCVDNQFTASQITDNIYLGDIQSSFALEEMERLGITHVLSAISGYIPPYPDKFTYKVVHLRDVEHQPIVECLDEADEFIRKCVDSGGKLLVHCAVGRSRSVALLTYYFMKSRHMSFDMALEFIQSKREIANPNAGFTKQLQSISSGNLSQDNDE